MQPLPTSEKEYPPWVLHMDSAGSRLSREMQSGGGGAERNAESEQLMGVVFEPR